MKANRGVRIASIALSGLLIAGGVTACSPGATTPEEPSGELESSVMWYTSIPTAASEAVAQAFMKENEGITVEVLRVGTFELFERFRSESAANVNTADVFSHADYGVHKQAKEEGLIQPYLAEGIESAVDAEFVDPDGYGWSNRISTVAFIYNTDLVPDDKVPTKWTDLLDPWWLEDGRLGMGDPAGSAPIYASYSAFIDTPGIGEKFLTTLADNKVALYAQGGQQVNAIIAGENAGTIAIDYNGWSFKRDGAPIDIAYPQDGVAYTYDFNTLSAKAPHPNAAKLFLDYLGSKDGVTVLADSLSSYVTRADVATFPSERPAFSSLTLLPQESEKLAENFDSFMKKFDEWFR